jgi:hypothetical protein
VQIVGTATHPQFQRYELYYAPWPVPSDSAWIFIGADAHYQQQPLGLLGTWDSRAVPDGTYALRVRTVKVDGNYHDSAPRRVVVANVSQPDTPTPAPTETPTAQATESATVEATLEPSPTVVVELPALGTAIPGPEQTTPVSDETPDSEAILPSASVGSSGGGSSLEDGVASIVGGTQLMSTVRAAAFYTIGAFVVVGAFFGVKALLVWLWHRMRP